MWCHRVREDTTFSKGIELLNQVRRDVIPAVSDQQEEETREVSAVADGEDKIEIHEDGVLVVELSRDQLAAVPEIAQRQLEAYSKSARKSVQL